jgi:hypothetical protein
MPPNPFVKKRHAMNTTSRVIRNLGLGLVAGLSLIQAAQAAPETYGPRGTVRSEAMPAVQNCTTTVKQVWDGGNKGLKAVTVRECASAKARKVKAWTGPRNTIPVYE